MSSCIRHNVKKNINLKFAKIYTTNKYLKDCITKLVYQMEKINWNVNGVYIRYYQLIKKLLEFTRKNKLIYIHTGVSMKKPKDDSSFRYQKWYAMNEVIRLSELAIENKKLEKKKIGNIKQMIV